MKIIKNFALAVFLALLAINTAQAVPGKLVNANIALQGTTNVASITWAAPATSSQKVYVFVPKYGNVTNALYRVYPKGKRASATTCISTDLTYPCYEVSVDQTQHKNAWTQLTLNGDVATQWSFVSGKGYVTVVASNLSTTQWLNISSIVSFETVVMPSIGQTYQGGIVFYVDSTGQHGLIAAPTDEARREWYNGAYTVTNATGTAIGTGQANTTAIIANQGTGDYAAQRCADLVLGGYSDWFLPSKDELNLMYTNIGQGAVAPLSNVGGFASTNYWSSSEYASNYAWYQDFSNGNQYAFYKYAVLNVRAVRAF